MHAWQVVYASETYCICVCKICQYISVLRVCIADTSFFCVCTYICNCILHLNALQSQQKSLGSMSLDINHKPKYQVEDHHRLMRLRHNDLLDGKNPTNGYFVASTGNDGSTMNGPLDEIWAAGSFQEWLSPSD